jgi:site-specific DNA recombinase
MKPGLAKVAAVRVALYARYSSDQQRATSIEDQFRNCRRRAEAEGWTIVREFSDAAMSGTDASRPQYQAMLAAASHREFDVLLLDDLSRLTRDSVEQERTIRRLEFQGLRIVATSDGYDSQSKARKVHRGVKGLMNEIFLDDLRERVHRGLSGQAHKGYWCGGKAYGFRLKPIVDPSHRDAYGQAARIGTRLEIDPEQAKVVREIFQRFAEGASYTVIAADLNARNVPSPGSTWKRQTRRCRGWMNSAVRVILLNPLYTGRVRWNVSQFVRDPDTGKYKRLRRPESDWHEFRDESLQIVAGELFEQAQRRTRYRSNPDKRLKCGYKPKYLLSGLLICDRCRSHYVIADARSYACSSYINGGAGACSNGIRVRRDALEAAILDPVRRDLLSPERVEAMAREMQRYYAERAKTQESRSAQIPHELQQLDARLVRLRERFQRGDPDMEPDELRAAIEKAEAKRRELIELQFAASDSAKVLSMLPKAAVLYCKQIDDGLDGDPQAALKARVILREMLGEIRLQPATDGGLWAEYRMSPGILLKGAGSGGRGDRI